MTPILDPSRRRRPAGRLARLAAAAPLALAAAATLPVCAQTINVSALVTGTQQTPGLIGFGSPTVPCGAACQYVVASNVGMVSGYDSTPGPFTADTWPPVYGAALGAIGSVTQNLAVPAPPGEAVQDGGSMGVMRRTTVSFPWQPLLNQTRQMMVQTWKGGSGAATVSITIRVTPTIAKSHYLEFRVPELARSAQVAYYVGGPSGYEPISKMPKQMQARSQVDVVVDGMPVWSGTSHQIKPQRWSPPYITYLNLQWGPSLDDSTVKLYLGNLAAGVPRTVSLVFRTDLRASSDSCYTDSEYGTTYQRCDNRREAMSLPAVSGSSGSGPYQFITYKPDVRLYTY
jgi:hypothetical protein